MENITKNYFGVLKYFLEFSSLYLKKNGVLTNIPIKYGLVYFKYKRKALNENMFDKASNVTHH